jgi:hypothetical protein
VRAARTVWVWQARWLMGCTGWQAGSTQAHHLGLTGGSSGGGGQRRRWRQRQPLWMPACTSRCCLCWTVGSGGGLRTTHGLGAGTHLAGGEATGALAAAVGVCSDPSGTRGGGASSILPILPGWLAGWLAGWLHVRQRGLAVAHTGCASTPAASQRRRSQPNPVCTSSGCLSWALSGARVLARVRTPTEWVDG